MKILMFHWNPCIRMAKEAAAVKKVLGHEVHVAYGHDFADVSFCDSVTQVLNIHDLRQHVETVNPDIIHCHNEPDFTTLMALSLDKPVVHDCHDMTTLRSGKACKPAEYVLEGVVNRMSSGCLYPSRNLSEWAYDKYSPSNSAVLKSMVSEDDIHHDSPHIEIPGDGRLKLVYEGGLAPNKKGLRYRYWVYPLLELSKHSDIDMYPSAKRDLDFSEYEKIDNVSIEDTLPFKDLIAKMSRYHFGICGFTVDITTEAETNYLYYALPNKLFDYMAAGIPIIVFNCPQASEFVERHNIGISATTYDESLAEKCKDMYTTWKSNVINMRRDFTMESEINLLEMIYNGIMSQ